MITIMNEYFNDNKIINNIQLINKKKLKNNINIYLNLKKDQK